jgi:RNAse (barnase) inhibitor barstar
MTPTLPKQFAAVHNGLYRAPTAAPTWRDAVLAQNLYWATLDLAGISTKKGFLDACAHTLQFPAGLGGNWDALADCLEDLSWLPSVGLVMHWRNGKAFASACEADVALALEILESAAGFWKRNQRTFVVLLDEGCCAGRVLPALAP